MFLGEVVLAMSQHEWLFYVPTLKGRGEKYTYFASFLTLYNWSVGSVGTFVSTRLSLIFLQCC